jgi:serine/threonine protein phosphatase PrpC
MWLQTKSLDPDGSISAFLGVYDGHGGVATSDWLEKNLFSFVQDAWDESKDPEQALTEAFRAADSVLLSPTGWMGMGERGVGGSKCGSTAAVACIFQVCCKQLGEQVWLHSYEGMELSGASQPIALSS